jgi:hypothetical protein
LNQWLGHDVKVVPAEHPIGVAVTESPSEVCDEQTPCLSGRDLSSYDYISVSLDGLVLVNVNPTKVIRLNHISDQ